MAEEVLNILGQYVYILWSSIPLVLIAYYILHQYRDNRYMATATIGIIVYVCIECIIRIGGNMNLNGAVIILSGLKFFRTIAIIWAMEKYKRRKVSKKVLY